MRNKWAMKGFVGCLVLLAGLIPAFAGDVFGGKVTEVRSAEILVVDSGKEQLIVRIAGIAAPLEGPVATEAKQFVTKLVLGKEVRARFVGRNKNGEMVSRLFVGDPGTEIGLELVRNGLARRLEGAEPQFGYKYGELSKAENEARRARRGLWTTPQPN
jgi:endonuclease YncB( thermonuclease family)